MTSLSQPTSSRTGRTLDFICSPNVQPAPSRHLTDADARQRAAYQSGDPIRIAAQRRADQRRIRRQAAQNVLCGAYQLARLPGGGCPECEQPISGAAMHWRTRTNAERETYIAQASADLASVFAAFGGGI